MKNFEKCTVAMLGGPCSQHVTGNTSRQNQPQSAIMCYNSVKELNKTLMGQFHVLWHISLVSDA